MHSLHRPGFSTIQTWQFSLLSPAVQNLAISVNLLALSSRLQSSTMEDRGEIVSWITLAGADTEDDDEGLSIFPPVLPWQELTDLLVVQLVCLLWNLSSIGSKHCDHPAVSHRVISQLLGSLTDSGSPTIILRKIIISSISGRRRELENCRDVDGLRGRDWKTNGCDKKYSSSSSEKNHPNKSFLISSYHQEQRFSQLHLCLIYLVLVSLIQCAGKTWGVSQSVVVIILPPP